MRFPDGLWYGGLIAWVALVGVSCLLPMQQPEPLAFSHADKLGHLVLFGLGGFWLSLRCSLSTSVAVVVALGIAIEGLQYFLPMRSAEFFDALADLLGALIGAATGKALRPAPVPAR